MSQALDALKSANALRVKAACVKRAITAGEVGASEVIESGDLPLSIADVLDAIAGLGWATAEKMLTDAEHRLSDGMITPARLCFDYRITGCRTGGRRRSLTERERQVLAQVVAEWEFGKLADRRVVRAAA